MPKLPRLTGAEILRKLQRGGWQIRRQRGSHVRLWHPDRTGKVTVTLHPGTIVKPRTLQSILDQAGLSVDEFIQL